MARAAAAAEPTLVARTWNVGGVERTALMHVPEKKAAEPGWPVVFVFHGHGGSARNAAGSIAVHRAWPEAVVVYMQGLPTPGAITDPDGKLAGWQKGAGDQADRDLKFFDAVLASLKADLKVDEKRVYATGHSNGGAFTYLLWAARGDSLAAVAPSAAVYRQVRDLKAKPVLHAAGENDELVKFAWQQRMIDAVLRVNGCEAEAKPWAKSGDLVGKSYESKGGTPVVTVIHPGTHKFPADAVELIVRFFKEH
jgi:polyhydroxybutyrate depolymerase